MTASLPSFVELMASLGLDSSSSVTNQSSSSARSSPSTSPQLLAVPISAPTRSKSSPSLREQAIPRSKGARYSPYAPTFVSSRRGSLSSLSSSSSSTSSPEMDRMSLRTFSASPHPPSSPRVRKRVDHNLTVNVFGSSTDLSANTPISSFVRRKTPGASPTSPSFPRERSSMREPMPFTLPTLPPFFPQSADSDRFPMTPDSESSSDESFSSSKSRRRRRLGSGYPLVRRSRERTGIRISSPPSSADLSGKYNNRLFIPVI